MSGSFNVAPSWARTTMDWLRASEYSSYANFRGGASEQLRKALRSMSYMEAEAIADVGTAVRATGHMSAVKVQSVMIDTLISTWNEQQHRDMVAYLKAGGSRARKDALGLNDAVAAPGTLPMRVEAQGNGVTAVILDDLDLKPEPEAPPAVDAFDEMSHDDRTGAW